MQCFNNQLAQKTQRIVSFSQRIKLQIEIAMEIAKVDIMLIFVINLFQNVPFESSILQRIVLIFILALVRLTIDQIFQPIEGKKLKVRQLHQFRSYQVQRIVFSLQIRNLGQHWHNKQLIVIKVNEPKPCAGVNLCERQLRNLVIVEDQFFQRTHLTKIELANVPNIVA